MKPIFEVFVLLALLAVLAVTLRLHRRVESESLRWRRFEEAFTEEMVARFKSEIDREAKRLLRELQESRREGMIAVEESAIRAGREMMSSLRKDLRAETRMALEEALSKSERNRKSGKRSPAVFTKATEKENKPQRTQGIVTEASDEPISEGARIFQEKMFGKQ